MLYYVMDQIKVKPGKLQTFLQRFNEQYVGPSNARGQKLVGSWIDPSLEMEGEPTEVFVLWSVEDSTVHYSMRRQAGADPSVREWWKECEDYQVERVRRIMTSTPFSPMQ